MRVEPVPSRAALLALALLVGGLLTPEARADAWRSLDIEATAQDTPLEVALEPLGGGDYAGYVLTWDGTNAELYAITVSDDAPPALAAASDHVFTTTVKPHIAIDGIVYASGDANRIHHGPDGVGAFAQATLLTGFAVLDVAVDLSTGLVVAPFDGGLNPFLATSNDGGANFVNDTNDTESAALLSLAVADGFGIAIDDLTQVWSSSTLQTNWDLGAFAPLGIDGTSAVIARPGPAFAVLGANGAALYTEDPTAGFTDVSIPAGPDFVCAAFGNNRIFAGDGVRHVFEVPDAAAAAWTVNDLGDTGIDPLNGIVTFGPTLTDVLIVGNDVLTGNSTIAWRNRAPSAGTVTSGGDIEGAIVPFAPIGELDPDGDAVTYAWACTDPGLTVLNATSATTQIQIGDFPEFCPGSGTSLTGCTLTVDDGDLASSAVPFTVNVSGSDPVAPVVITPLALFDGATPIDATTAVPELTQLRAEFAIFDDCPSAVTLSVLDAALTPIISDETQPPSTTSFVFTAPADPSATTDTPYTFEVKYEDQGGNPFTALTAAFLVAPTPAPVVALSCDANITAGASTAAIASITNGVAVDPSGYAFTVAGGAGATPSNNLVNIDTDACALADDSITVSVTATGATGRVSAPATCTILVNAAPVADPVLTAPTEPIVVRLLDEDVDVVVPVDVRAPCPDAPLALAVDWNVSALPAVLVPADASGGVVTRADPYDLALRVPASAFTDLDGVTTTVTATATREDVGGPARTSPPADIVITFVADEDLGARAKVFVDLALDGGETSDGDIVAIDGVITSDLAVALPNVRVALRNDGLAAIADGADVTLTCAQGRGRFTSDEDGNAVVSLSGLARGCDARVRFLARKGVRAGGVSVDRCTWGDGQAIASCFGGTVRRTPAALAFTCGAHASTPLAAALAALAVCTRRRRR